MDLYSNAPRARGSKGITSAHGRNGFGSRPIQQAPAGHQEVQFTSGQQQAFDLLAPIFSGDVPGARAVLTGFAGTGKFTLAGRLIHPATAIPAGLGASRRAGRPSTLAG